MILTPVDIRAVWLDVKDRVAECLVGQDLIPEEIYHLCRTGDATLLQADDGFVVARVIQNKNTLEQELLLLIGWGKGEVFNKHMPQLKDLAQRTGCKKIVFASNRQGYERKLPPEWKRKFTLYELEV